MDAAILRPHTSALRDTGPDRWQSAGLDRVAAAEGPRRARPHGGSVGTFGDALDLGQIALGLRAGLHAASGRRARRAAELAAPQGLVRGAVAARIVPAHHAGALASLGPAVAQRVIHVGIGVFGRRWCSEFLKTNVADGTIEVVALVDVDPQGARVRTRSARAAGRALLHRRGARIRAGAGGLLHGRRAARASRSDHRSRDRAWLDILCEKPIADSMEATNRIARKVKAAGRKMAVTMSHRFDQDKTTLRRVVRSGILGPINAIGMRFHGDMRQHMAWSSLFRHRMERPAAGRRLDPSSGHHRRPRRRALRYAVRDDLEAALGRVPGRHRRRS